MGEVIEVFEDVAEEADCAVFLCHHTREGNGAETSIESARGASSIVDAPRFAEIAEKMTKDEAKKLGIAEERHKYYFKIFNGKPNFVPPIDKVDWYELKNVQLYNAPGGNAGDNVGAVTRWTPPAVQAAEELTSDVVRKIREEIGTTPRWKNNIQADMWAGQAVASVMGLPLVSKDDKTVVKTILKTLITKRVLKTVAAWDQSQSAEKIFVIAVVEEAG
jgi:hypothetical protein